ncbi:MAG TPA: hypothetical protein H9956_06890 [Candidatus Eisenbergiella pullicola]|nr:hypothetical protein [Candidatus Eisenbergiella pullicola]
MKKRIAVVLSIIFILGMTLQASAAEKSVGLLYNCYLTIGAEENGMRVIFETNSTTSADEIGCKDIVLQEKVNGDWRDIDINGGYERNSSSYGASAVYTGAVEGRTYRAYCTHYAKYGNTTKTLYNETGEMVYN